MIRITPSISLDEAELGRIVELQLERVVRRLAGQQITLHVAGDARTLLAQEGYDPQFGARPLKRAIQQQIENPVAKLILQGRFGPKDVIPVDVVEGALSFERVVH